MGYVNKCLPSYSVFLFGILQFNQYWSFRMAKVVSGNKYFNTSPDLEAFCLLPIARPIPIDACLLAGFSFFAACTQYRLQIKPVDKDSVFIHSKLRLQTDFRNEMLGPGLCSKPAGVVASQRLPHRTRLIRLFLTHLRQNARYILAKPTSGPICMLIRPMKITRCRKPQPAKPKNRPELRPGAGRPAKTARLSREQWVPFCQNKAR